MALVAFRDKHRANLLLEERDARSLLVGRFRNLLSEGRSSQDSQRNNCG
jgi:hypothetical protein